MTTVDKALLTLAYLVFVGFAIAWTQAEYKLGYADGRESVFAAQHDDSGVLPPYENTPTWKRLGLPDPQRKGRK